MRFARSMVLVGAAVIGGLAGCEQQQSGQTNYSPCHPVNFDEHINFLLRMKT